jgi:hypothetical protein
MLCGDDAMQYARDAASELVLLKSIFSVLPHLPAIEMAKRAARPGPARAR